MVSPRRCAVRVLIVLLCGALLSACAFTKNLFRNKDAEAHAVALLHLQLNTMRFADEYAARISEPLLQFQNATTDPTDKLAAQNWKVSQATAAYTIASGANPMINAVDMVVFATLSRMVIEDAWITERFGNRTEALRIAHAKMETLAWASAANVLSSAQIDELRVLIDNWRARNPRTNAVAYIHFDEFAKSLGQPQPGKPVTPGSLFSFLGLDPLSQLDPAVRELAQARQLAERALYFAERTPNVMDMQVERIALQFAVMPEIVQLLGDLNRVAGAAQQTGDMVATLPQILATERAATIEQLSGVLDSREGELKALLGELRTTLAAGTVTSDSLKGTITSFDQMMARFDKPASAQTAGAGRPFDITEYTETARELAAAARQLDVLITQVDNNAGALSTASEHASQRVQSLVDYTFWRLVQLGLVLVVAITFCMIGYRAVVRRWNRAA
jgi:hypothetical protein